MVDRFVTIGDDAFQALDPRPLKEDLDRLALDTPFWGRANSINCPIGQEPGSAYFLLNREDGETLDKNALQPIIWTDGKTDVTFRKYVLSKATLVGLDGDGDAPYLMEFRDKRHLFKMSAVDKEYNVRRTTRHENNTTTDLFFTDTLNSGSPWTWQEILDDLWTNLPSALRGTSPTLPYTPVNQPENFRFHGSAWDAIGEIMASTHSVICLNPIADTITVQRIGDTQAGITNAQNVLQNAGRKLFTANPIVDLNLASAAETIRFFFPKRCELENQLWDNDTGGTLVNPYHTIDKTTGLSGAQAGTVLPVRTTYIAELDSDGTTINNATALDALADELRDKIKNRIDVAGETLHDIYGGAVNTITPGCEIHEMTWRDYGDDDGLVTELFKHSTIGQTIPTSPIALPIPHEITFWVKPTATITKGSSGTCKVYKNEADTGQTITAKALAADCESGLWAVAWYEPGTTKIYVSPAECSA